MDLGHKWRTRSASWPRGRLQAAMPKVPVHDDLEMHLFLNKASEQVELVLNERNQLPIYWERDDVCREPDPCQACATSTVLGNGALGNAIEVLWDPATALVMQYIFFWEQDRHVRQMGLGGVSRFAAARAG